MDVRVLDEAGYGAAMEGLALNKGQTAKHVARNVALRLSKLGGAHSKFLESIMLWIEVDAPRYWWAEADTYRIATKQSESTMHTIVKELKEGLQDIMFEDPPLPGVLEYLTLCAKEGDLLQLKAHLPEGFLQRRVWCMSYKTLKNIVDQRENHRLPHWGMFCEQVREQIEHPEFIWNGEDQ